MEVKDILTEIAADVADVYKTEFSYTGTVYVPNSHTQGLTFERGMQKVGKEIETCVLYVDIRNSVALTAKHHSITMAKIYTAFIKAVIKAGRYHKASTRNIIGDRVMLVFPSKDCFHSAVACAISINHIAQKIIAKQFPDVEFKCGIGIDYGKLKVIKVGIQRNGTEQSENKGLVWTGYPANIASRLTDLANKTVEKVTYKVNYNANRNPLADSFFAASHGIGLLSGLNNLGKINNTPYNLVDSDTEWDEAKFAGSIELNASGELKFKEGKLNKMERKVTTISYPAILITQAVYTGLKEGKSHLASDWLEQPGEIRDVSGKVYGCGFTWKIS